jgi:hypothetical protein
MYIWQITEEGQIYVLVDGELHISYKGDPDWLRNRSWGPVTIKERLIVTKKDNPYHMVWGK